MDIKQSVEVEDGDLVDGDFNDNMMGIDPRYVFWACV